MFPIVFLWFLGRSWADSAVKKLESLRDNTEPQTNEDLTTSEGFLAVPSGSAQSTEYIITDVHPVPNSLTVKSSSEEAVDLHSTSYTDLNPVSSADNSKPKGPSKFKATILRGLFARKKQKDKPEIITSEAGPSFVPEPQAVVGQLSPSDESLIGSSSSISNEVLAEDVAPIEEVTRITDLRPIDVSIRSPSADSLSSSNVDANEELQIEDRLDRVLLLLSEVRNSLKELKEFVQILEESAKRYLLEKEAMERQLAEQERLIAEIKIILEEHERKLKKLNLIEE